jgi:hypothetical protein
MCEKWQFRCAVSTSCWIVKVVVVVAAVAALGGGLCVCVHARVRERIRIPVGDKTEVFNCRT